MSDEDEPEEFCCACGCCCSKKRHGGGGCWGSCCETNAEKYKPEPSPNEMGVGTNAGVSAPTVANPQPGPQQPALNPKPVYQQTVLNPQPIYQQTALNPQPLYYETEETERYAGCCTWVLVILFFPLGLLFFCCPCDSRRVKKRVASPGPRATIGAKSGSS